MDGAQRYREIAPLFCVANSQVRILGISLITKGEVRGVVGSEKHVISLHIEVSCFFILIYVNLNGLGATDGNVFISVHKDF